MRRGPRLDSQHLVAPTGRRPRADRPLHNARRQFLVLFLPYARLVPWRNSSPSLIFDYVLYLGSLIWSVELAYLEERFHILSGQWDLYLLATAALFFFLAYRFDNRFVLSLALSALAGWYGLTISRWPSNQDAAYRQYAVLYSLTVAGAGAALRAPRAETALLRHLSEYCGERSLLGAALRSLQSAGLRSMVCGSPGRLCRISGLGTRAPPVLLRRLCRRVRLRGRQFHPHPRCKRRNRCPELLRRYRHRYARPAGPDRAPLREGNVRAYNTSDEEALRARVLLKDWAGEGFLTAEQYQRMEQETVCDFRRTNIFLRLVLFLFTLIIVGAAVGLFFVIFRLRLEAQPRRCFPAGRRCRLLCGR
jgi:hypothetical protein